MDDAKKNPDELGALWLKDGAKGPYMTGTINGQAVVCFKNKSDNPKAPAWRVLKSRPKADVQPTDAHVAPSDADDSIPFAWIAPFLLPMALVGASVLC